VVRGLPDVVRVPASEPLSVLGILFVLVVFFAPAGSSGSREGRRWRRPPVDVDADTEDRS
jgi:ABC-type branched-subunit amino acid transport system permease subunit